MNYPAAEGIRIKVSVSGKYQAGDRGAPHKHMGDGHGRGGMLGAWVYGD